MCVGSGMNVQKYIQATSRVYRNFDEINFYIRISNFLVGKRLFR